MTDQAGCERKAIRVFKVPAVRVRSRPGSLALAGLIAAACLASCGNADDDDGGGGPAIASTSELDNSSPPTLDGEKVLIKTQIVGFTGKVSTGSVIGGAA